VRKSAGLKLALALAAAAALAGSLLPSGSAVAGSTIGSDFIVRCYYNGNVSAEDPIMDPGSVNADHLHAFFGNMASGGATKNRIPFPNIQSGDYSTGTDTMEQQQTGSQPVASPTNCEDSKDTAGYWIPEPFMVTATGTPAPQAYLPGGSGGCGGSITCSPGTNLHMRVYYIPHGATANQEIPDGSIMVTGYPAGCAPYNGTYPDGCSAGGPSYPVDVNNPGVPAIVQYSCGADQGTKNATPLSAWPYNCNPFLDADDSFSDGAVALVTFPSCWDGKTNPDGTPTGNFPAPNSPAVNGLPTQMVPGYVAPWIKYTTPSQYYALSARPANDFAYTTSGNCTDSQFPQHPVVQLEERLHLLTNGQGWGLPSTCTGDGGTGWNTRANGENGTAADDSAELNGNDHDALPTPVSTNPVVLYGHHQCSTSPAPNPDRTHPLISFACTPQGLGVPYDPNCSIPLTSPTNCAVGQCYVGAYGTSQTQAYGWETLHADYWQTWQEAAQAVDGNGGNDFSPDAGTFGDLIEDCTNNSTTKCATAFVTNSSPDEVYGSPNP
jgi:hypothetical protein